nr:hypothetical protein [Tanacetum cinerariifolium]
DNLIMVVPNLEGTGYPKETIHVEYEWKPTSCSTCLIFGHSLDDCLKAPKRMVNKMDKGNGGSFGAYEEGFVEVKKKKPGGECVLADDDGTPLIKVDYSGDQDSEDEIEFVDNKMESYLASKPPRVGY